MRWHFSKTGLIIVLILLFILILHYSGILNPLERIVVKILNPVSSILYNLEKKFESWWLPRISEEDYRKIEAERNSLVAKNIELEILAKENEELRKALNFPRESKHKFVVAGVIGRDTSFSNFFVLDKGENDGIKENYPVISPEGILVGKIAKVEDSISHFILPTDKNFQTAAFVLGKSKGITSGLVRGEKGLSISMEFIPQDELIEKDDIVATSGLELDMPEGLIVGKITDVYKEARDIFGKATVSPLLTYGNLRAVMIIVPQ